MYSFSKSRFASLKDWNLFEETGTWKKRSSAVNDVVARQDHRLFTLFLSSRMLPGH